MAFKIKYASLVAGLFILSLAILPSCYYDNEEELYPIVNPCDTIDVSFKNTVLPVLDEKCNSCHATGIALGGIVLDTYNAVKNRANNGSLVGSIRHQAGWSPMPKGGQRLSSCKIDQISAWVNQGAPNN